MGWRFKNNEINYLKKVLSSDFSSGADKSFAEKFEIKFAKYHNQKYAIASNSGTSTLHQGLIALGVGHGDEVIIPALTVAMCGFAVYQCGAVPVYCDVNPKTYLLDPNDLKKKITNKTKAIMAVHIYGLMCDMTEILKIAKRTKIKIIEDCAQCFLGKDDKKRIAGTVGDVGSWSLESSKHISCSEGGIVTTKNSKIFTIIFLFIPLFEALGFTIINYISYTVDGYGEGLAYLLILYIVYLFLISDEGYLKYFLIGFCSFIIIGIRPNYIIFCFSLIFNYIVYLYIQKKEIPKYRFKIFFLFFGFAFILLIPIHNYIYGNEYILLVKTENVQNSYHVKLSDYSLLFKNFFQFNIDFNLLQKILNHLAHYIKIYELWFMIILLNLVFVLFTNHQIKLKILASNLLLMHGTFLFFLGDPRYSMGCWLISFIIFMFTYKSIYYSYFFYLKAKFFQQNNRLK